MCSVSRFVASCIFIKSRSHPAPASGRRPERLVLRPYSRYFFPFLRRNIFTNSAKVHAAAPKPSTMAAKYTHGPSEKRRASQPRAQQAQHRRRRQRKAQLRQPGQVLQNGKPAFFLHAARPLCGGPAPRSSLLSSFLQISFMQTAPIFIISEHPRKYNP